MLLAVLMSLPAVMHSGTSEFPKWEAVKERHARELAINNVVTKEWGAQIAAFKGLPRQEQLTQVNDYINHSVSYVEDIDLWHQVDYWATPTETLSKHAGDCEDFAIAKYYSLKQLGFNEDDLRITTVVWRDQLHIVLIADGYVLDNKVAAIAPVGDIYYYQAVFSINADNWWNNAPTDKTSANPR